MTTNLIDFRINDAGDLILEKTQRNKRFKMSFVVAPHNAFRLVIGCNPPQIKSTNKKFHIQFSTANTDSKESMYSASAVQELEEISQLIMIRLKTSEEESDRDLINTKLQKLKHTMFIDSEELFGEIKTVIKDKICDLLDSPIINVEYINTSGNFYCQNISVSIYTKDNNLIYTYTV